MLLKISATQGDDKSFISAQKVYYMFFRVVRMMTKKTNTDASIENMRLMIPRFLTEMKETFMEYSKSNFSFMKFHIILHCPTQVQEFGSLDLMDSNKSVT